MILLSKENTCKRAQRSNQRITQIEVQVTGRSFGMIYIRIGEPKSLQSMSNKRTDESSLGMSASVPLMHHVESDERLFNILHQISRKKTSLVLSRE